MYNMCVYISGHAEYVYYFIAGNDDGRVCENQNRDIKSVYITHIYTYIHIIYIPTYVRYS